MSPEVNAGQSKKIHMKVSDLPRIHEDWRGHVVETYGDMNYRVGRYELNKPDGVRMRVDYVIDPLLSPNKYGEFFSFFVSRMDPQSQIEYARVVLEEDTPKIGMGEFDFTNDKNKKELERLLAGNIRTDVALVLRDVLQLSADGKLEKVTRQKEEETVYVPRNS